MGDNLVVSFARPGGNTTGGTTHADAQFNLGVMYEDGIGVSQDHHTAVTWYRKAAEQGHAKAQNNLGTMFVKAQGVPQDYDSAVDWFRKAAAQGDVEGQFNLGLM